MQERRVYAMCAPSRTAMFRSQVVTAKMRDSHSNANFRGFAFANCLGQAQLMAKVDGCHLQLVDLTQEARILLEVTETSAVVQVVTGTQSGSTPWDDSQFVQVAGQEKLIPFSQLPDGISGRVVAQRGQVYVPDEVVATPAAPEVPAPEERPAEELVAV